MFHLIPGRQYKHNVTIKDDMNNMVKEPLRINIKKGSHVCPDSHNIGERFQLLSEQDGKANLTLQTWSTRQNSITLEVELEECPPGFKLERQECECNFEEHYGLLKCDDDFHGLLTPGLWAGMVRDETTNAFELVTSICPRRFCNYNNTLTNEHKNISEIKLPWKSSDLQEAICGETRKGILCGECAEGYTTYFHSPDLQCDD